MKCRLKDVPRVTADFPVLSLRIPKEDGSDLRKKHGAAHYPLPTEVVMPIPGVVAKPVVWGLGEFLSSLGCPYRHVSGGAVNAPLVVVRAEAKALGANLVVFSSERYAAKACTFADPNLSLKQSVAGARVCFLNDSNVDWVWVGYVSTPELVQPYPSKAELEVSYQRGSALMWLAHESDDVLIAPNPELGVLIRGV